MPTAAVLRTWGEGSPIPARELIEDERLALARAAADREHADGAADLAQARQGLLAKLELLRRLVVHQQVQWARFRSGGGPRGGPRGGRGGGFGPAEHLNRISCSASSTAAARWHPKRRVGSGEDDSLSTSRLAAHTILKKQRPADFCFLANPGGGGPSPKHLRRDRRAASLCHAEPRAGDFTAGTRRR